MLKRLNADPKDVTTIFGLLTVFLLIVEGILGFWLFLADDKFERIVAGVLMTIILIIFLITIFKLYQLGHKAKIAPHGFPEGLTPAKNEVLPDEIIEELIEKVVGVEGTFRINRPPDSWTVKQVSMHELMMQNLNVKDESAISNLFGNVNKSNSNISLFKSKKTTSVIPNPGESTIQGRNFPTALETIVPTQLAIIPLERAQPPLYIEFPLVHNVVNFAAGILKGGIMQLENFISGTVAKTNREFVQVEVTQYLEHITVDDNRVKNLQINFNVIGIKGDLTDHLLVMQYPTFSSDFKKNGMEDLDILKSLVNSFEPQKVINAKEKMAEMREKTEMKYDEMIEKSGKNMFMVEFMLVISRIKETDLDVPEQRNEAIKTLQPFKEYAKKVNFENELVLELLGTLEDAIKGNSVEFKRVLSVVINALHQDDTLPDAQE